MQEMVEIFVNNGLGIGCVVYLIWFQATTMKEMLNTLQNINERLTAIETKIDNK